MYLVMLPRTGVYHGTEWYVHCSGIATGGTHVDLACREDIFKTIISWDLKLFIEL